MTYVKTDLVAQYLKAIIYIKLWIVIKNCWNHFYIVILFIINHEVTFCFYDFLMKSWNVSIEDFTNLVLIIKAIHIAHLSSYKLVRVRDYKLSSFQYISPRMYRSSIIDDKQPNLQIYTAAKLLQGIVHLKLLHRFFFTDKTAKQG